MSALLVALLLALPTTGETATQAATMDPAQCQVEMQQPQSRAACPPDLDTCLEVYQDCKRSCRRAGCPAASIDPCNVQAPCDSLCECICG